MTAGRLRSSFSSGIWVLADGCSVNRGRADGSAQYEKFFQSRHLGPATRVVGDVENVVGLERHVGTFALHDAVERDFYFAFRSAVGSASINVGQLRGVGS